jgi:iron complex transport system substrate-binding protein
VRVVNVKNVLSGQPGKTKYQFINAMGDGMFYKNKTLFIVLGIGVAIILLASGCAAAIAQPTQTPLPVPTSAPTATSAPQPLMVTDSMSNTVTLKSPAMRIVSLAPSNTEILFAIGAGDQVVGRDMFSDYPAEAKNVTDIGGGFGELNTETIVSLKPDLVLATALTPLEQVNALQKLGLTVFVLGNPTDLDGMYENLRTVASLTGHKPDTEKLVDNLKSRVAVVKEKMATVKERPSVFYELDSTDPSNPWTAGPGTFIDTLLSMASARNVGSTLSSAWVQISVEKLLTENPDYILLGDATLGGVTPEQVAARAGWNTLSAVKNSKVLPFEDNLVSRPGPRLVDGLEALAKLLHPDQFK